MTNLTKVELKNATWGQFPLRRGYSTYVFIPYKNGAISIEDYSEKAMIIPQWRIYPPKSQCYEYFDTVTNRLGVLIRYWWWQKSAPYEATRYLQMPMHDI